MQTQKTQKKPQSSQKHSSSQRLQEEYPLSGLTKQIIGSAIEVHKNIGYFKADFDIEKKVIVELKATSEFLDIHKVQTMSYIKVSGRKVGLLLNFGVKKLGIKRLINTQ